MKPSSGYPVSAKRYREPLCTPSPHAVKRGVKRKYTMPAVGAPAVSTCGFAEDMFFLADEGSSPLLSRFLSPPGMSHDQIFRSLVTRVHGLLKHFPCVGDVPKISLCCKDESFLKIIACDAERTFCPKEDVTANKRTIGRQAAICEALLLLHSEIQDYHQGLGYIVAFLHVFLRTSDVVRVALGLHRSRRHSMGYFRKESQSFVRDARVFHRLLRAEDCKTAAYLERLGVVPELYAGKWFIGLCVHVLPWIQLLDFWEGYFTYGTGFLLAFGLAYVSEFRSEICASKSTAAALTILRLEDPSADWRFPKTLEAGIDLRLQRVIHVALRASSSGQPDTTSVAQMRLEEAVEVRSRVEQARMKLEMLIAEGDNDDIVFSDEESNED
eukprot:gnl/MRDRNA2_/MRDRNA2_106177_c0_seq1.p1 gnl/MRDRNA2_/MRDRNA2_106177_c0~~gnl/MRDRNA2_/MRDRNA2_106177_c0_seq1.p1  ORF type:complete len:384 (-),score=48.95 gnl/MRDRNA2_/MRDRNA2_106177_c0_seq1:77-1228(-)